MYSHDAFGQNQYSSNNKVQIWVDNLSNIKIEFSYSPETPVIDNPTELKFNVLNLQNGRPLGDLSARVIILTNSGGQERSFMFPDIVSHNGSFSVKYLFPDSGLYQVISRINSKNIVTLDSFSIPVAFQPSSIGTSFPSPLILSALIAAIIIFIVTIYFANYKRKKIKSKTGD